MAEQPSSQQGGTSEHSPTTRSPIRTRSLSRLLLQQASASSAPEGSRPAKAEKRHRNSESDHGPCAKKPRSKSRKAPEPEASTSSGKKKPAPKLPRDHEDKSPASRKQRGGQTTGSCASNRRRSSRVTKLNLSSGGGGGGTSRQGSAMSGLTDTGQEGSSTSFSLEESASGGGAATTPSTALAASTAKDLDDNEMGRLQALLEARGLPPHLFGVLGPRMQHLLHRSLGGGGSSRAHQLLAGLQATGDEGAQLQAAMEMCQLLVMGNEDTLAGFPVKQAVPVLSSLLAMDHNFDMMNHACRALTYMMEALPRSSTVVVDAIPVFLEKLQVIQCMDVAEQSLTALEMLSRRHSKAILHARGVSACLTYLDFFSINAQRAALAITANCCQNLAVEEFPLVSESLPLLSGRLQQQDRKCMESVCLAFSRLVEGFQAEPDILREVAAHGLLGHTLQLLVGAPPSSTFVTVLRMLAQLCAACPDLAVSLLRLNVADTLRCLLLGPGASLVHPDVELLPRSPQELFEITSLIGELMPRLPSDGIFAVDALLLKPHQSHADGVVWQWKDDRSVWHPYAAIDSKIIEAAHQAGEDEISLSTMGRTYTLDFNSMQQINEDSGTTRPVPRKVTNASPQQQQQPPAATAVDSRAECLQSNLDLAASCIQSLFSVLYEVYSSSAGPAVRHKCLRALLRMVYFAPAELLRRILKHQPVSSHVAAMLASQDLRVVVAALQMAEILMQKLPDVFGVYFRREGVMHQIRWLARMELPAVIWSPPPEEDHYLSLGQVRLSDVLKRKRTPKRGNSTNRKVRTEEASASLEASASVSASPVLLPSTSGRGCSSSGGGNKIAAKTNSLLSNLNPSRWARWSSSPLRASAPPPPDAAKAAVAGNKDKIRAWIKERAGKLEEMYFSTDHREGTSHPAMSIFNKLLTALSHLDSATDGGLKALEEMRSVVMESDISSFELNHSGLITKLLAFLTTADPDRENRLRIFLNVFLNAPLIQICSGPLDLKPGPFSQLVAKLNACLSQLEQFSVKVHDLPGSASGSGSRPGTSALKFFNTHQLKCNLQRHPSCSNLRQWRGGPVKIDPLALVQAIERYLVIRGYGRLKDDDDEASDDDNSDEDIDDTMAAMMINQGQGKHKLQFLIGEHVLPYNMTVYQAIRQFAASDGVPDGQETDIDSDNPLGSTNIWIQTHVIWYRPVASEETDTPPSASKRWSGSSRRSNKGGRTSPKKKSSDDLWNEGIVPEILSPLIPYLSGSLPESVTHRDQSLEVITLLRVLYGLSSYWGSLYDVSKQVPALSPIEFVNPKLTGKANRQLQDPLAIMTGNVPSWLAQIAYACPFLFPFETRHLLFYVTSFDRDRALQRLLDMSPELSSQDSSERVTPRLERRKRTVSREELLKQAESVLQDLGNSKALLEIQYDGEVGTGLGPTLEFYALVSRELQRSELDIWRGSTTGNYVIPLAPGLFPLPLSRNSKPAHVARVRSRFKLLGRFLAKALMDSRVVDIGLSPAFYSWLLGQEATLGPKEMALVDPEFAQTLRHLEEVALIKQRLEQDKSQTPTSLKSALDNLKLDGQPIDSLGLDFTLPGTPNLELQRGGRDMGVSAHNVDRYVKLVAHWSLVEGVRRQMEAFREGFESIFPLVQLGLFYPYELDQLFCGSAHAQWDLKTLAECCRPDHGYLPDSRAIRFLFHILSNQTPEEQRHFLQFVTGSPRLPVGGLKSLTPPLTIVRKTLDASDDPDDYLPSVMTCVNYLKLPDYSSIEKMREKLNIAVFEGQHSFHLS